MCAPAGVGTEANPTPFGYYFVALLAQPPEATWGPFVMVTSAFADTITDWEQANASVITIEGPLNSAGAIGVTGAAVTTGAVRVPAQALQQLRVVPAGTPLDVVAFTPVHLTRAQLKACP
jgi:hypothetical protein